MAVYKTFCPSTFNGVGLLILASRLGGLVGDLDDLRLALIWVFINELKQERTAKVTAIPYETKLVYQYPDEEPRNIYPVDGGVLTYTFEEEIPETCEGNRFRIEYRLVNATQVQITRFGSICSLRNTALDAEVVFGKIAFSFENYYEPDDVDCHAENGSPYKKGGFTTIKLLHKGNVSSGYETEVQETILHQSTSSTRIVFPDSESFVYEVFPLDGVCPSECKFSVFEDGVLVFSRTESICPIVNVFTCGLDEDSTNNFNIDLDEHDLLLIIEGKGDLPITLEELLREATSFYNGFPSDTSLVDNISSQGLGNPNECLLFLRINEFKSVDVVKQICSTPDCTIPQYTVECEGTRECPDETCEVECGDYICCYNAEGISVKQFSIT